MFLIMLLTSGLGIGLVKSLNGFLHSTKAFRLVVQLYLIKNMHGALKMCQGNQHVPEEVGTESWHRNQLLYYHDLTSRGCAHSLKSFPWVRKI